MFFGALALLVLPVFLVIAARSIKANKEFGGSVMGKLLRALFYLFAAMAAVGAIALFYQIVT